MLHPRVLSIRAPKEMRAGPSSMPRRRPASRSTRKWLRFRPDTVARSPHKSVHQSRARARRRTRSQQAWPCKRPLDHPAKLSSTLEMAPARPRTRTPAFWRAGPHKPPSTVRTRWCLATQRTSRCRYGRSLQLQLGWYPAVYLRQWRCSRRTRGFSGYAPHTRATRATGRVHWQGPAAANVRR